MNTHIKTIENGTVWYEEKAGDTKHEGKVEIYRDWVALGSTMKTWVPRENVTMVMEA